MGFAHRAGVVLSAVVVATGSTVWLSAPAQAAGKFGPARNVFASEVSSIVPDETHRRLALEVRSDTAGNSLAAWMQKVGTSCQTRWATRSPGAGWSAPHAFSGTPGSCPITVGGLVLAMNGSGRAVAAWLEGGDVWAAIRPAGGSFGSAAKLSAGTLDNSPTVSINAQGKIAVGWVVQGSGFADPSPFQARIRPTNAGFSAPETVNVPSSSGVWAPRIAVGPAGDVVAAWARTTSTLSTSTDEIDIAYRPANGQFPASPTQAVEAPYTHGTGTPSDIAPDLAFDSSGRATMVWVRDTGTAFQVRSAAKVAGADTFGSVQTVNPSDAGDSRSARLAIDPATNTAVAAWLQCSATCVVRSASRPSGGIYSGLKTLSAPMPNNSSTITPGVGFTSTGTAVAVWSGPASGASIDQVFQSRRPKNSTFGAAAAISGPATFGDRGPSIGFDGHGNAIAMWDHLTATPGALLRYSDFLASYYQPDAMIKKAGATSYTGAKVYNTSALHQTVTANVQRTHSATFVITVANRSSGPDSFSLKGPGNKSGYSVKYLAGTTGSTLITSNVVNGTYTLSSVAAGKSKTIRLVVTVNAGTAVGASTNWLVTATSRHDTARKDVVNAIVKVVA